MSVARAALIAPLICLAATVAASGQSLSLHSGGSLDALAWPAADWSPPGAFTRTAIGELTGDGLLDLFTLAGTQPVVIPNVVEASTHYAPTVTANDIDVESGGNGATDALVVVGPQGLSRVVFDALQPAWVAQLVAGGVWADALRVRSNDLNDDGTADIAALQSDQVHILVRYGGITPDPAPILSADAITDLAIVDWGNVNERAIAALSATNVRIYDASGPNYGSVIATLSVSSPVAMTPVPPSSLAVLCKVNSLKSLSTFSFTGARQDLTLPQPITYVSLSSGDGDEDGDFDLAISHRRSMTPIYLSNVGTSTPQFNAPSAPTTWNTTISTDEPRLATAFAGNNQAQPVFADIDDDGRADLILPLQQSGPAAGDNPGHVCLFNDVSELSNPLFMAGFLGEPTDDPIVAIQHAEAFLRLDPQYLASSTVNAVKVLIWRQPTRYDYLDESPEFQEVFALTGVNEPNGMRIAFDIYNADDCFYFDTAEDGDRHTLYWVDVQPLRITYDSTPGTGYTINQAWPRKLAAMVGAPDDACEYMFEPDQTIATMRLTGTPPDTNPPGPYLASCAGFSQCSTSLGTTAMPMLCVRRRLPQHPPGTYPSIEQLNRPPILAFPYPSSN